MRNSYIKVLIAAIISLAFSFSFARDLVITKLNVSPIKIGNRQLKIGDSFSDADIIYWSSSRQDMKAKPKSGGLPRHYSAAAFNKKSQKSISIKQYLNYLNKTNRPGPSTLDAGDLYMQKSEKSEKFPEKRIALVIGNSIYGLLGKDLDCPISDAEDVSNTLNELGFDTYTLYDATYEDFQRALLKFSNVANAESYEVALFYFCGHGNQNDGMNYLLPSDAKNDSPEDIEGWISFDAVFESLAETECKTKLVFLDACRNTPRWQAENKPSKLDQYDTHGSYVVYSTAINTTALGEQEEESRNTPFGAAFLESVVEPVANVSLTIKEIGELVKQKTQFVTGDNKRPQQIYLFGVPDVDFAFVSDKLHFSYEGFDFSLPKDKFCEGLLEHGYTLIKEDKSYHYADFKDGEGYSKLRVHWIGQNNKVYMVEDIRLQAIVSEDDNVGRTVDGWMYMMMDDMGREPVTIDESREGYAFDYGWIAFGEDEEHHLVLQYVDQINYNIAFNMGIRTF